MNIPQHILQHYLRNTFFFCGTACAGKSTISKALAEKHNFHWLDENVINYKFAGLAPPQSAEYSPTDWTEHFQRPVEEYWAWLEKNCEEQFPLTVLEAIQLSADKPVAVDCAAPVHVVLEFLPPENAIFLITDAERAARVNLTRPDHQDLAMFIKSLPQANEITENIYKLFVYGNTLRQEAIRASGTFFIERTDDSTVENMLAEVERYFKIA
ncbi:hypothetical protein FACS1894202_01540 [Clostridia bacterium]|nr:hypothetical protein FACS1894202_01540 [Clostridia bacterium]